MLGGAGFLGSHIAAAFVQAGSTVSVLDGLLPRTGGRRGHLSAIAQRIRFIDRPVEAVTNLQGELRNHDLIIDAMGWTLHHAATEDVTYDRELNAGAHAVVAAALVRNGGGNVVYLGSRGQYGRSVRSRIREDDPLLPVDIQGIHKVAGESYFRVNTAAGLNTVSLRIANCFGPRQPYRGDDIGLIGSMIRDLMEGRTIEVYGRRRRRSVVFAPDLAHIVLCLCRKRFRGFTALNVAGRDLTVEALAASLVREVGRGRYRIRALPDAIRAIDVGSGVMSESKLKARIGSLPKTPLPLAIAETVAYMRGVMV